MPVTDNLNLAQLGITSGDAWGTKYPTMQTTFISQADYLALHQNFRTLVLDQSNNNSVRSQTTTTLKILNAEITKSVKFIKNYLTEEYGDTAKSYYLAYGFVFEGKNHTISKDNDLRMQALDILVAELSKTNNPFANRKYGLVYWEALRNSHRDTWTLGKTVDGDRSMGSSNIKTVKEQAKSLQNRLRAQIRVNYPDMYKNVLRDFGFQSEKY